METRVMPKRPCALALTDDDSTIIAADKFGDIYSLPLLFSNVETPSDSKDTDIVESTKKEARPFVPAANNLTVHSQRNRLALENQKKQGNKVTEKLEPTFEHKLLLGHVSMLTDVAVVNIQARSYIISSDRDEHIRVSRGIPQSHIIEGFCLGHTEFVSRLCLPSSRPNVLISGGGDNELFVWDWLSGQLLSKADVGGLVSSILSAIGAKKGSTEGKHCFTVAISSISHAELSGDDGDIILVTSEGSVFQLPLTYI